MKHLRRINESEGVVTLRDLIGETKETFRSIIETTKGCFTNVDLDDTYGNEQPMLDKEVKLGYINKSDAGITSDIMVKGVDDKYWSSVGYCYMVESTESPLGYDIKIISYWPGDERGCVIFNNTFISSGHDGSYLWNVNDPREFASHTW